jgi:hypothetical protein
MGIASKGLDFYTYVSSPGFKVSFAARGNANAEFFESAHTNVGQMRKQSREIDSGDLKWAEWSGQFWMSATRGDEKLLHRFAEVSPYSGNLAKNDLGSMLNTRSIIEPEYAVSYGFFDAGRNDRHRAYLYVTDNYENWMGNLLSAVPALKTRPFGTFVLPGSHDAGMFTGVTAETLQMLKTYVPDAAALRGAAGTLLRLGPLATLGVRALINAAYTQKDDITTQLRLGARYFDFRPGYNVDLSRDQLRHQHALVPGYEFTRFLADVVGFLRSHPHEVVVVNIQYSGFVKPEMKPEKAEVERLLAAAVAGSPVRLGGRGDLHAATETLLAGGTRLIILHEHDGCRDSYSDDIYQSGDPTRMITALADTVKGLDADPSVDWAVLQLQGTCAGVLSCVSLSDASSALLGTKAPFDHVIYPWLIDSANVADKTTQKTIALLNDFVDNALTSHAIAITRRRATR